MPESLFQKNLTSISVLLENIRNQLIDLYWKSIERVPYESNVGLERVPYESNVGLNWVNKSDTPAKCKNKSQIYFNIYFCRDLYLWYEGYKLYFVQSHVIIEAKTTVVRFKSFHKLT